MKRYTHVILDEVHDRSIDLDFLLIIVRMLLHKQSPFVKIILMSATINTEKIASYFKMFDSQGNYGPAPILELKVERPHKVLVTYLDGLDHIGASRDIINLDKPGISSKMFEFAVQLINFVLKKSTVIKPSFLVFLPGIQEIKRFKRELINNCDNISEFHLIVLHSSLPIQDCNKAFDGSVENKIILATNIAESSVTLPGVRFVIDFCLTKYLKTDTATNMQTLMLNWASKESLIQREGRVGRMENGQVIRLIYKDQFDDDDKFPLQTEPEIQRISLETVVLKAKQFDMGTPTTILGKALDPPPKNAVVDAILCLKEIGGLTRLSKRGKFKANDGELTFAGEIMSKLPLNVRISKLIILGHIFNCLEECIIIGAGMASKSIFASVAKHKEMELYSRKLEFAKGSSSDAITMLNVYREWRLALTKGLAGNYKQEQAWCKFQMLDMKCFKDMNDLIEDIKNRLRFFDIKTSDDTYRYSTDEKRFVIKMCLAGAFYPNFYQFGGSPPLRDEYGVLNNMDPCRTVYFKSFQHNRIGQLYESQVREKLCEEEISDEISELKVHFDGNSERLQVQFLPLNDENLSFVPGDVQLEVYKAIKFRKLGKNIEIRVMK